MMYFQYAEHLAAPVSALLMPLIFLNLKAIALRLVFQFIILKVGLLVPSKDYQMLCPIYIQL